MFWGLSFGCPTGLTGQTCPTKKRLTFQKKAQKSTQAFLPVCKSKLDYAEKRRKKSTQVFSTVYFFQL